MKNILLLILALNSCLLFSQETFTRKDSLQGGMRPERSCFDVRHYGLDITINPSEKTIKGFNEIDFRVVTDTKKIQLDLFENMKIDSIVFEAQKLKYKREFNAVFIDFSQTLKKGSENALRFYYSGKPIEAKNAPWDGGFVYSIDMEQKPWIGVAVQGTGASLWYPVKDTQTDEPDEGATIKVAVPNGLMNVSNGRLVGSEDLKNGYTRWDWRVTSPINNYDITVNIGNYVHFGENYRQIDLDYYVLPESLEKAKKQFEEVKSMLDCFNAKFGPYPFTDDSFKLVETAYLGMEHQSAVAYGNKFRKGYLGTDLSSTGKGLLFDFIIVHESGHEWFGNSITSKDIADMWIHEGFTCYSESVYLECQYDTQTASTYINGLRSKIANDVPVIGPYGVNHEGSGDMYIKGALMLHTIRNIIADDGIWWALIYNYAQTFRHKIIDTETVIGFFNKESGIDLTQIFSQYLRYKDIPVLELRRTQGRLEYRWSAGNPDFNMPVDIYWQGKQVRLAPTKEWALSKMSISRTSDITVRTENFLVEVKF